jgi:osmoprotectant transport system permease protein
MTETGLSARMDQLGVTDKVSLVKRVLMKIKQYSRVLVPIATIMLMLATVVYYVNNPGGTTEARLLTYSNVLKMLRMHITLVLVGSGAAILTSVPLGILITRPSMRRLTPIVDNTINVAQTVPGLAVLALFFSVFGLGFRTAVFALWLYSLLPILRNTSIGIQSIQPGIIEAARGMGMRPWRILTRIELPLALPIIMAGIKTATVVLVGSAALATFIGAGSLGLLIVTGIDMMRASLIYTGAILSALLAILLDNLLESLERYLQTEK